MSTVASPYRKPSFKKVVSTPLTSEAKKLGEKVSKAPYTIGLITIMLPAAFKAYTIYQLFREPPESMTDTVYKQIIGLNFGCLLALLIMYFVNRKDIQQNKRKSREQAGITDSTKIYSKKEQGMIKIFSLILSLINTILGIIIAVMIYVNVTSDNNLIMMVVSISTILLDLSTLWSVYTFINDKGNDKGTAAISNASKLASGAGRFISTLPIPR